MNSARQYVLDLYAQFPGRVPVKVGLTLGFGSVYPFVFEGAGAMPLGLVGCAWNEGQDSDLVQIYHVSVFKPNQGAGSKILRHLCSEADRLSVRLNVQAQPQYIDIDDCISDQKLQNWYQSFGFEGATAMTRRPNAWGSRVMQES
jgi:hypothetical protein